jgi:O-antigen/teichoic acid export membrane protein
VADLDGRWLIVGSAGALAIWAIAIDFTLRVLTRRAKDAGGPSPDPLRRVLHNAAVPIVSQLFVRGIDLAVAIALLRILGPEGNGEYAIAVIAWLYVKTISDFGLSILAAREVARDPAVAPRVIGETTLIRWIVLAVITVPVGILVALGWIGGSLSSQSVAAMALLFLSIVPASLAEAISSVFTGMERMALAAWLNVGVNLLRAPLVVALALSPLDVTGVALAALIAALYLARVFQRTIRQALGIRATWSLSTSTLRWYLRESWPLLVNALLVSLFFRIDVFVVQAVRGDTALGVYDASYKLINLLTIVPAYAVLAVFPLLVRRADDDRALREAQRVATYLLVTIAWIAVATISALATPAITVLAGHAYLPEAAVLLSILVWFAPLSFLNGVTQYVLIAQSRQRRLLPVFLAAVAFNVVANVALVPPYGARAAAVNTVATEAVIVVTFWLVTRSSSYPAIDRTLLVQLWRPTVTGLLATVVALVLRSEPFIAAAAALATLAVVGAVLRIAGPTELALIRRVLRSRAAADVDPVAPGRSS